MSTKKAPSEEDDESVLDESEQTMRPKSDSLHQQRIQAWHPVLDPVWVIVALFYLGVILVPVGTYIHGNVERIMEISRATQASRLTISRKKS